MAKPANGKTAIVTGAGTGIGKATATALLADGWNTVFVGRRKNVLDEAVTEAGKSAADGARALVTVHPSFLLRIPDAAAKAAERERFVADLEQAKALL